MTPNPVTNRIANLRLSLRQQITGLAVLAALIATSTVALLVMINEKKVRGSVSDEVNALTISRVERNASKSATLARMAQDFLQKEADTDLALARAALKQAGGVKTSGGSTTWSATNQTTLQQSTITIPTWSVGGLALKGDRSFQTYIPVIDAVGGPTKDTITLFQRMNDGGDMLRVASSAAASDGKRIVGTYIPATMPDNSANPVVQAILGGQSYRGRAYVVDGWDSTAYEPITVNGHVAGMLGVSTRQERDSSLRQAIVSTANTGGRSSVAIYYGPNSQKFSNQPIMAPTGLAEETKSQWLPEVLAAAPRLEGETVKGITITDSKSGAQSIIRYVYYKPWDWIIVIAADSRDFQGATDSVSAQFHSLLFQSILGGLFALVLSAVLAYFMSKHITDPMADLSISLTSSATQVASSAVHEQANVATFMASSNQIASAVKEISATSQELLRNMVEIADAAEKTAALAKDGRQSLKGMDSAMQALSSVSGSISSKLTTIRAKATRINSVVTAITKVADQTNLLSLNAAIEAEKAGEAGAGFAVVAREIRRLADQSAIATLDIEQMVEEMQEAVTSGVEEMRDLSGAVQGGIGSAETIRGQFGEIIERVESIAPRYETVHQGMQNQSEGAQQISEAMWQLTETARQTSDSVNDLNDVSRQLHEAVRILKERIFKARTS
jgi:methyl-accepting chemotaxis protein